MASYYRENQPTGPQESRTSRYVITRAGYIERTHHRKFRYYSSGSSGNYSNDSTYRPPSRDSRSDYYPNHGYRRRRWPPNPSVEEESSSVANEWPPQQVFEDEVPNRGKLDQETLMEQLLSLDTRFVLVSNPTNKTSKKDNIKPKKRRDRNEHRETVTSGITKDSSPILERRKPSPYSFTRTPQTRMTSGDILLSPESIAPPVTASMPRSVPNGNGFKTKQSHTRKNSSMTSSSSAYKTDASDDSDVDRLDAMKHRSAHGSRSARNSSSQLPGFDSRQSSQTSSNPANPSNIFKDSSKGSSNSKPASSTRPTESGRGDDTKRQTRNVPIPGSSAPRVATSSGLRTPRGGNSPRIGSTPASPKSPFEPLQQKAPQDPYERLNNFNIPMHGGPKQSNKGYYEDPSGVPAVPRIDVQGPSPGPRAPLPYPDMNQSKGGSSLPYPMGDDPIAMPDQFHFINPVLSQPSPTMTTSTPIREESAKSRSSTKAKKSSKDSYSSSSTDTSIKIKSNEGNTIPKMKICPRRRFSTKHRDWYQLEDASNFDVCPTCYDNMIKPTKFRDMFKFRQTSSSGPLRRCDFGKLWVRFAWLTTLNQDKKDISLIFALADINNEHNPCPDNNEVPGKWFGLLDRRGNLVDEFRVCPQDKARIETLFPSLEGALAPIPSSRKPGLCAFRATSKRLPSYLDALQTIHASALHRHSKSSSLSGSYPGRPSRVLVADSDLLPLVDLANSFSTQSPECPRDRATPDLTWHFIPDMPDLTVCPQCYVEIIAPDANIGNALAKSFTTVPRAVPALAGQAPGIVHGMADAYTCCLYSDRMRDIWDDSVTSSDPDGGVRKWVQYASDRRRKEIELAAKKVHLVKTLGSLRSEWFGEGDEKRAKKELERVEDEWGRWE